MLRSRRGKEEEEVLLVHSTMMSGPPLLLASLCRDAVPPSMMMMIGLVTPPFPESACQKVMIGGGGGAAGTAPFHYLPAAAALAPHSDSGGRKGGLSVPFVITIIWARAIDKIALLASPSFPSYRRGTRCKVKYLLDYANERWKEADRPGVGTERFPTFSEPFEAPKIVTIRQPPTAWRNHRGPPLSLSLLLSAE